MATTDEAFSFDNWADYRAAVLQLLASVESSLCIYDPDLSATGLSSLAGVRALQDLALRSSRHDAVRILLKDAGPLEREQPRLVNLVATYGHRILAKLAPAEPLPKQAFMIADGKRLLLRFQEDMARGRCELDARNAPARHIAQFETIWMRSQPGPTGTPLGL